VKIAVLGATGLLGAPLAELLESQGHEVRRLHRSSAHHPVDLSTGAGLKAALADVEVVVNAANEAPPRRPGPVMVEGTQRLLEASDAHHVCVSIVGCDKLATYNAYYAAKVMQEQVVIESGKPYSIVRSTQFHEFLGAFAIRAAKARIEIHSKARFAPVAVREAAAVIARTATAEPTNATINISGPETLTVTQLRARRGLPLPLPLRGGLGKALRAGVLTLPDPDVRGVLSYPQWLAETQGRPWRPAPGDRH
jgi:uncharacterized protein YbjT (DUF2867 family)